mmetsp:Transcript_38424/g.68754  ORF Transcript_38424/g.68754 Transcript_38424/m.68754 type:complete len:185 (-) Transcript_38424:625-1179(-)
MNALAGRAWYHQPTVSIPVEAQPDLFAHHRLFKSPYMLLSARMTNATRDRMQFLTTHHSLQVQTVEFASDPWFHKLLVELGKKEGIPMVFNIPFRPEAYSYEGINYIEQALDRLEWEPTLDHVLIEDVLFSKVGRSATPPVHVDELEEELKVNRSLMGKDERLKARKEWLHTRFRSRIAASRRM